MYLLGKFSVTAVIPERLGRLQDIAYNLWWSWHSEAIDLYREIDLTLWEKLNKNPIRFLKEVSQKKLENKLNDQTYLSRYDEIVKKYDNYMNEKNTWFKVNHPEKSNHSIAYFSAEYGLNEVLPVYSGGLGVLSGDHCKSASDLDLPFTAIGLFYKQGYFSQRLNKDGWQETNFTNLNVSHIPITPALNNSGEQIYINIEFAGRVVYAKVWKVQVGRVYIYLMDTDVEENQAADRILTARLYGGDQETRIQQEIFLGIGGIRVLDALGIKPTVYHMNEGHSSFMGLELIRKLVQEKGLPFRDAKELVSSMSVFTTHTPVPAGNDTFPLHMVDKYFSNYWGGLGISRHEFLDLGLKIGDHQNFNMTVLALSIAGRKNGVSELHGAVSRNIFNNVWPGVPEDEVPIGHITNGIHTLTWLSPNVKELYTKYMGEDWDDNYNNPDVLAKIDNIPDDDLWETHHALKTKMILFVRDRLKQQRQQNGESIESIREVDDLFDPDALTIGFARRFATYKRANLIFRNVARIQKILNDPKKPMQIVFAGKAHPADGPAHEVIKNINDIARQEGFRGKVILVENYNMTLARNLVQGVDVWLNNPRRPLEASGTSGQKVAINGVLNFSILDGWWCEGYNGKNGWIIGDETPYDNEYYQDNADSEFIYETLEKQIIPLYYDRNENNIPTKWVAMMKESIKSLMYLYSTHRMVKDYAEKMYIPSMVRFENFSQNNFASARELSDWLINIERNWPQVQIFADRVMNDLKEYKIIAGETAIVSTTVQLGNIDPNSVKVEVYFGNLTHNNAIENPDFAELKLAGRTENGNYRYEGPVKISEGGEYAYTFRVLPYHKDLINKFDPALVRWAVQ